jgi:hypothetical protein
MPKIPKLQPVRSPADVPIIRKVPALVKVPAHPPIVGTVISDVVFQMPTHYVGGRTTLCGGEDECEYCGSVELRFFGLLAVWDRNESQGKWVQLPAQAVAAFLNQLAEMQVPMHGVTVKIQRERKTIKSPVVISIDKYAQVQSRLPKPWTPEETIERIFSSPKSTPIVPVKLVS